MAFNIKDEQTVERARRIAARTGESITEAIATAVAEREARLTEDHAGRRDRILQLLDRCGARLKDVQRIDHDALLYDPETGLPR